MSVERWAMLVILAACSSKDAPRARPDAGPPTLPYGTWPSTITAADVFAGARMPTELTVTEDASWWIQPDGNGHHPLMRRDRQGATTIVAPDVATTAHNYGGGAYVIARDRVIVSSAVDGRLYRVDRMGTVPLTPTGKHAWADCTVDPRHNRALCVHDDSTRTLPVDTIAAVDLDGGVTPVTVLEGHDFFASPRFSPDGDQLAWVSWDFPRMPWDGTDLWTAPVAEDGSLGTPVHVAGGATESVLQPEWSPDGELHYLSDREGAWRLHRVHDGTTTALSPAGGEVLIGRHPPGGVLDAPTYAFTSVLSIVIAYARDGADHLALLETVSGLETPLSSDGDVILALGGGADRALVLKASALGTPELIELDVTLRYSPELVHGRLPVDDPQASPPEVIRFPTADGATAVAYFYPPRGAAVGPAGARPPLIVQVHGGPTARTLPMATPAIQFWTSRGFAVVDVNYGGSVGYGRAYRQRLAGQAGIVDVADCVAAARYLVQRGDVDGERLVIRGGSSGGYTALMAVMGDHGFKSAGAWAAYTDLEALRRDTAASDKFESRYDEMLVGPYPERQADYVARSPIHHPERVTAPIIFVHGDQDPVVPARQSRTMYDALVALGKRTAYVELANAGHASGPERDQAAALDAELAFHRDVLGL